MICWLKSTRIENCIGKEAFDSMVHTEYVHDEETGEEVKKLQLKQLQKAL